MPDGEGNNAGEPDDNDASASPPTAPPDLRLRYGIVAVVWLLVVGLAGIATRAGDPGFGQVSFILLGALLTWVVLRAWPPPAVEPPPADIVIETPIDAPEWGQRNSFLQRSPSLVWRRP